MADNGLVTVPSAHSVKGTIDRFESAARSKGLTVFARIDHAADAQEAGLALRPTELLIFGRAKAGTPLMQSLQTIGVDLPLKALAWEDSAGKVWPFFNDPVWLAARHGLGSDSSAATNAMAAALAAVSKQATGG
jgi:uncharacterized protein (DUF302 family)